MGNEQSTVHEPKAAREQPSRSALSRSRSLRSNANALDRTQTEAKYLPTYQQQTAYPMRPVEPYSSGTGGIDISPQYGWYVNTTPPTPEIYYNRPQYQKSRKSASSSDTSQASSAGTATAEPMANYARPNPIFQGLQDKHKTNMDWSNLPL